MKTVWIFNHYAAGMFISHSGRHYSFAKYLLEAGYQVRVFCSSVLHGTDKNLINDGRLYYEDVCDGIPYVVIKGRVYTGNGPGRVLNMLDFYRGLFKVARRLEKPDAIIGSSVHPLACVAAIKLAGKYRCQGIAELRDIWPDAIIDYGLCKKNSLIARFLYGMEKWIYAKADNIIFTMEGGRDHIIEKGWDKAQGGPVELDKVCHINNGVDMNTFDYNLEHYPTVDPDLDDPTIFKAVYAGTIRRPHHLETLVDTARTLRDRGCSNIKILVYGNGDEREQLIKKSQQLGLSNIIFKGSVEKKYIPYILSRCHLGLVQLQPMPGMRFGGSQNKSFEYMASGIPVIYTYPSKYDYIEGNGCGVSLSSTAPDVYADAIIKFQQMPAAEYEGYCSRARQTALNYDFSVLSQKLINLLGG